MKKALVLAFALVLGLGAFAFAGPLSGSWDSSITLSISGTNITVASDGFSSKLVVAYTVGSWEFDSTTKFTLDGWKTQKFTADGTLGAFTINSALEFDPGAVEFTDWDTTGSVSIAGIDLSGEFLLTDTGSGWTFGASGAAGDLTLGADVYLNSYKDSSGLHVQTPDYCFCFSSVKFTASFPFACIDNVDATLDFDQTGFAGVTFDVKGIAVPNISWLTFDAKLNFVTKGKGLTLTPKFNLGKFSCITLYYDVIQTGTYQITGLDVYALKLTQEWNGVTFTDISIFDVDKYIDKVDSDWNSDYWELFQIKSTGDSCCGGGVNFTLDTYFQSSGTTLFDWGETDASVKFGIGSTFTINGSLKVDSGGLTEITAGFTVEW